MKFPLGHTKAWPEGILKVPFSLVGQPERSCFHRSSGLCLLGTSRNSFQSFGCKEQYRQKDLGEDKLWEVPGSLKNCKIHIPLGGGGLCLAVGCAQLWGAAQCLGTAGISSAGASVSPLPYRFGPPAQLHNTVWVCSPHLYRLQKLP